MEESAVIKDATFWTKEVQESDRSREQTLVNIGRAFTLWRDMCAKVRARSDAQFAMMLLYSYKNAKEKPLPVIPLWQTSVYNRFCPPPSSQSAEWVQVQNMNTVCPQQRSISNAEQSIEVTLELDQMEDHISEPEATAQSDDDVSEEEESGDEGDASSNEDWLPHSEEEESDQDEEEGPYMKQLCTDCGTFHYNKTNHVCEHKIKLYVCNICGKRCVTELSLKVHSNIHSETYEHYCKYCCASFKTKLDKLAHQEIHQNKPKPYQCPDCTMTFASRKEQKTHLKNHRGQKKYVCDICGLVLLKRGGFHRHLMIHTGMKPHTCSTCKRTFTQRSHLKSHMRVHTGEQPFKCQHCDKTFNHNVSLKSHIQRYHPLESEDKDAKSSDGVTEASENVQKQDTQTVQRVNQNHGRYASGRPVGRPKKKPQLQAVSVSGRNHLNSNN